ncbi:polyketide synthase 2 [Aspergillus steynii IBT 23096]|uniref:Polyketide synthase 2 n=1 Tax=Aspergillus steynii IBT 23096 TaxID=1392250 RepID=A0A2I2G4H2_9EURO|nr:polyketide synthase 2 [Aspergillus steynii IBT 23096]PLB47777.1 polyketide synthase 2 [Aspergillus steynii IBT 23096]
MAPRQAQEPIAIVGLACRLPGGINNTNQLWEFLEKGDIASREVPDSRFTCETHYDGSLKPGTMRPPGGMFLRDVDPADFDASFFEISGADAVSMDPNQRQMMEVVYEGLENSGLTLERLDGASVACFVASFATDYAEIQNRDPLDRASNHILGIGRASMANRLSYFLNVKGPSVTIDTACSSSMVGLHLAVRALHNGEAETAVVATSNLYLNPEHVQDMGSLGQAHSPTGLCHTFDATADGYIKSEAVSAIIIKRLTDAMRDGDPIRAVVRGTASTSNGRTNGLASPSSEAQASAIRKAYDSAGIANFNDTAYLECHGTGTPAGDPTEVNGVGSVFAATRDPETPLILGSIKANLGHSEPAAGSSGVLKAVLSIERGFLPGTPSLMSPNPKIDFMRNRVRASRTAIPWPDQPGVLRRASVNSFGYGGSNAVIEQAPKHDGPTAHVSSRLANDDYDFDADLINAEDSVTARPYTLVLSANDTVSLQASIDALCTHLLDPRTQVSLPDLAYTLSERRSRFWHRAYITAHSTTGLRATDFVIGKRAPKAPRLAFVFTGQGAQWPEMGAALLQHFPCALAIVEELDQVLQSLSHPPAWSLRAELTESRNAEHLRQPAFSQPIVTALQLALLEVFDSWGIVPTSVVGHSSGEIAAAYVAGLMSRADAIKAAFYRGKAAVNRETQEEAEMLAVGLGPDTVQAFLDKYSGEVWIACFNSPTSVTISGHRKALEPLADEIRVVGHFARLLQVDLAYHSGLMSDIAAKYNELLDEEPSFHPAATPAASPAVPMFSSVTGAAMTTAADGLYWKTNMTSPVRFSEALTALVSDTRKPDILIEIGPAGALAGPVSQVLKTLPGATDITYTSAWARGADPIIAIFDVAGRLFNFGVPIDFTTVNAYTDSPVRTVIDLPNYRWNHSIKYWYENASSLDWRFKSYKTHDLIGSKVLGSPWQAPSWRKRLDLADVPWLRDHAMGADILMPAAGFIAMGLEAMYQKHASDQQPAVTSPSQLGFQFRSVRFQRALILRPDRPSSVLLSLIPVPGSHVWHEFCVASEVDGTQMQHCVGRVRVQDPVVEMANAAELGPLQHPSSAQLWYKAQREIGMTFGPAFQNIQSVEATSGQRVSRARLSLAPPPSRWDPQSYYPLHPAVLDACFQSATPALVAGERSKIRNMVVPSLLDEVVINPISATLNEGLVVAEAVFNERGRRDQLQSYFANVRLHDPQTGALFMRTHGLHIAKLDAGPQPGPHTLHQVVWQPDISLLTQEQLRCLSHSGHRIATILNLASHRSPTLRVLEVNLEVEDTSSVWFESGGDLAATHAAYTGYDLLFVDTKTLVTAQTQYENRRQTSFHLVMLDREGLGLDTDALYGLAIIKGARTTETVEQVVKSLMPLLVEDACTLLMAGSPPMTGSPFTTIPEQPRIDGSPSEKPTLSSSSSSEAAGSASGVTPASSVISLDPRIKLRPFSNDQTLRRLGPAGAGLFQSLIEVDWAVDGDVLSFLGRGLTAGAQSPRGWHLVLYSFNETTPRLAPSCQAALEATGWKITSRYKALWPVELSTSRTVVMVLDELSMPLLPYLNEEQWTILKSLVSFGLPLVWVTKGAQHDRVTDPDRAFAVGLFRVARREDPTAKLTVLDVESSMSPATDWAIEQVLRQVQRETTHGGEAVVETEYAERDGILYTQRLMPDAQINAFRRAETEGTDPVIRGLHETDVQVRIHGDRVGTLDLSWCEEELVEPELDAGLVEVEVKTVGVNFKDVATIMGIVPENEFTIGCECAGVVRRVGPSSSPIQAGDRVAVVTKGTYANRVRVAVGLVHRIPDWLSFEDAATIPLVCMTAYVGLVDLANLRKGQSVLIHSATGGVGLAAIQLARFRQAEIFATVGTDEKREFLSTTFDIPHGHIFSSHDSRFAEDIRLATNSRGVDVILNSLTGELLDASWRLCADGGTMVEIGKRDIVGGSSLAMEPFDRNCSFRAIDLSYTNHSTSEESARVLREIFTLVENGHIGPIHPITTFGFDAVPAALAYIRRGQHIGKVVITNGDAPDVHLPIRPALRKLQLHPDLSYLIVGGLKGLCGSLAIYLARHGARHMIVCSRSGLADEASARIVHNCAAWGATVVDARGDVVDYDFVRQLFKSAAPPIAGLIQGAMVLRDKPYESMTVKEYHDAIAAKFHGTWNLHCASQEVQPPHSRPLDFFTMLSSVSGVIGNKGQANYAAGNTFLDSFASYRQGLGLAANTVDLGAIKDVGYMAEVGTELESRFDTRQWTPINERALREILTYSILQQKRGDPINAGSVAQLVTGINYPLTVGSSDLAGDPRFGYLFGGGDAGEGLEGEGRSAASEDDQAIRALKMSIQHSQPGADPTPVIKPVVELLSSQVTKVLRLEIEVEPGKALVAYGLDSLSAVEIKAWARMKIGVDFSTLEITNASSIYALGESMATKLLAATVAPGD